VTNGTRRKIDVDLKARIALEALREHAMVTDLPTVTRSIQIKEAASMAGGTGIRGRKYRQIGRA
jgi:hypothetical protein